MSDRDALLRAICENPDDDAPRLVYADWLDEHGDPRQAEFIRVQIELARGPAAAQRFDTLKKREDDLWGAMKKWRYLPSNWISLSRGDFKRGFNIRWVGRAADFLAASPTTAVTAQLKRSNYHLIRVGLHRCRRPASSPSARSWGA
jgi:uncharacterized protein (TIGR02996 family)